jgi:hypothetical protein
MAAEVKKENPAGDRPCLVHRHRWLLEAFESAVTLRQRGRSLFPLEILNVICSQLFELARVLVRVDHIANCVVNANHSIM